MVMMAAMLHRRSFRQPRQRRKRDKWGKGDTCEVLALGGRGAECCSGPGGCNIVPLLLTVAGTGTGVRTAAASQGAVPGRPGRPGRRERAALAAIGGYRRWISPRTAARCRFTPTCSAYGATAISRYGFAAGVRMISSRLARCRPGVPIGTADPVP